MKAKRRRRRIVETGIKLASIVKKPISIPPNTSILDARDILIRHRIGRLVVAVGQKPVGIVTEKDIARSLAVAARKPIAKIAVRNIMSKELVTAYPDSSIYDCASLMQKNNISSIVVKKKDGKLFGVITKTDLVSAFLSESIGKLPVSKVMTKKPITVRPDDSIFEVESTLLNNHIGRVIVAKGKVPVGVITHRDFVPAKTFDVYREFTDLPERAEVFWNSRLNEFNVNKLSYLLTFSAKDIMTPNPLVINPNDDTYTAAILMIRHGISGLPVVRGKHLVGIITKTDLANVFATKGLI